MGAYYFNSFLLLLLSIFLQRTLAQTVNCVGRPNLIRLPNPTFCSAFVYCVSGVGYPGKCSKGKFFNPKTSLCDTDESVCKGKTTTTTTSRIPTSTSLGTTVTNPSVAPVKVTPIILSNEQIHYNFTCDGKQCGLYPNPNDCKTFFLCSEKPKLLKHCNDGQLFDTKTLECQPPNLASCWKPPSAEPPQLPKPITVCPSFHFNNQNQNNQSLVNEEEIILSSPIVTNWGEWQTWSYCPENTYFKGINVWRRLVQAGNIDQAGIVSLSMSCNNPEGKISNSFVESHAPGIASDGWPNYFTCTNGIGIGFRLNSQRDQGASGDDLATDNVQLICSCGPREVYKPYEQHTGIQSGHRGEWTQEQICKPKQALCGLQAQMHQYKPVINKDYDNTGLNNLKSKCCSVPDPLANCIPTEKFVFVRSCVNMIGEYERKCDFYEQVGLTYNTNISSNVYNFYESIGYSLEVSSNNLKEKFKNTSNNTYDWTLQDNEIIWKSLNISATILKSIYIKPNSTSDIYQIMGECFYALVKTNWYVRVDKDLVTGNESRVHFQVL